MPVTYAIDRDSNFIATWCRGTTTLAEVEGHFDELEDDSPLPHEPDVLLDLSEMTSLPTPAQMRAAADRVGRATRRIHFRACAIVVGRDALFGMIRMFEVFAQEHFGVVRILRDRDAAVEWLAVQRAKLRSSDGGRP